MAFWRQLSKQTVGARHAPYQGISPMDCTPAAFWVSRVTLELADSRFVWGLRIKGLVLGSFMMHLANFRRRPWDPTSAPVSWMSPNPPPTIVPEGLVNSACQCFIFSSLLFL